MKHAQIALSLALLTATHMNAAARKVKNKPPLTYADGINLPCSASSPITIQPQGSIPTEIDTRPLVNIVRRNTPPTSPLAMQPVKPEHVSIEIPQESSHTTSKKIILSPSIPLKKGISYDEGNWPEWEAPATNIDWSSPAVQARPHTKVEPLTADELKNSENWYRGEKLELSKKEKMKTLLLEIEKTAAVYLNNERPAGKLTIQTFEKYQEAITKLKEQGETLELPNYNRTPSVHESPEPIVYPTLSYESLEGSQTESHGTINIDSKRYPLNDAQKKYISTIMSLLNDENITLKDGVLINTEVVNVLTKPETDDYINPEQVTDLPSLDSTLMSRHVYDALGIIRKATEIFKDKISKDGELEKKTIDEAFMQYAEAQNVVHNGSETFSPTQKNRKKLDSLRSLYAQTASKRIKEKAENYIKKRDHLVIIADETVAKENNLSPHQSLVKTGGKVVSGLASYLPW